MCLRRCGQEGKQECKRLLIILVVPQQRGSTRKKWPGVVVVVGCGSGAGRRKRFLGHQAAARKSGMVGCKLRRRVRKSRVHKVGDMRDVRRYTGQVRFLAATRVALSLLQANFATTRAQAITYSGLFSLKTTESCTLSHITYRRPEEQMTLRPCEGITRYRADSKGANSHLFGKFCGTPTVASSSQALCHRRSNIALAPPCAKLFSRLCQLHHYTRTT